MRRPAVYETNWSGSVWGINPAIAIPTTTKPLVCPLGVDFNGPDANRPGNALAPPPATEGLGAWLHALRRHWLVTVLVGAVCGVLAASVVFFFYRPQFNAVSSLHIASNQEAILFYSPERATTAFEIYKNTQQQYLKSRFVLNAALRNKPEIASASIFRGAPDEVDWLGRNLSVEYPGNSELMNVSLQGENAEEASALVNAVVNAYMTEVVSKEQGLRAERLSQLDRLYADTENEWRSKRSQMKVLAERLGSGERDAIALQQQIALQQSSSWHSELTSIHAKLMRLKAELQNKKSGAASPQEKPDDVEVTDAEIDAYQRTDPANTYLWYLISMRRALLGLNEARLTPTVVSTAGSRFWRDKMDLAAIEKKLAEQRPRVREELERRKTSSGTGGPARLASEIRLLETEEKLVQKELADAEKQAKSVGGSSIELEMMCAEITRLEGLMKAIGDEREKLAVEIRSKPRITVVQKAEPPAVAAGNRKLEFTALAGSAGLFLPLICVVWWDVRSRRINTTVEVSRTGLQVIGAVPLIPSSALGRTPAPSSRTRHWRHVMDESMDAISARLLYAAERNETRVVLVSSAINGEGKTTLATQLAMSLAHGALVRCWSISIFAGRRSTRSSDSRWRPASRRRLTRTSAIARLFRPRKSRS